MKRNIPVLILFVLVLALIAYVLLQQPGERSRSVDERDRLLSVDSSAISKIAISSPQQKVVLAKKGSEWVLEQPVQYRADQAIVKSFLGEVADLRARSVVSANREKHPLFQVDTSGTQIMLTGQGSGAGLIVGKTGSTYGETYVRLPDGDEVYLVDANLASIAGRAVADWRDRTIVMIPRGQIREIKYQYGDTTFALALADSLWRIGTEKVEQWVVNNLLYSLSNLRADDFVDDPGIPSPPIVGATTYHGITLWFMRARGEESYTVKSSTTPQRFKISAYEGDQILKRKKDLLKKQ